MEIEHISVSRNDCYKSCPQKYKYRYHLKVVVDQPKPIYFSYGTLIHKVAEEYVSRKGETPIEQIASDVKSGKIIMEDQEPFNLQNYRTKFPEHVQALKRFIDKTGFSGYTEYPFLYDLDPPNGKLIKGFIDRIIVKEDYYFIVDYKTTKKGRWRKGMHNIAKDIQLRMYARVIQKEFKADPKKIRAALYYVEGAELVAAKFSEKDLISTEKMLLETYKEIEKSDPDQVLGRVGDWCRNCDYKSICPFYAVT